METFGASKNKNKPFIYNAAGDNPTNWGIYKLPKDWRWIGPCMTTPIVKLKNGYTKIKRIMTMILDNNIMDLNKL